ncbi:hypothetical protein BRC86_00620 [Halobacteriales archaeon QS_3_64_16]|nr:MAG: hypothetical protein BRC86_00620 [Halobacteriales archaeon QS_3_64_16]
MANDDLPEDADELPIPDSALSGTADRTDVSTEELVDTLLILDADLRGRHAAYEANYEYVTSDGTRAYLADSEAWENLVSEFDLDGALESAARRAHTEGATLLVDRSVENPQVTEGIIGIVVGVDTAEVMG